MYPSEANKNRHWTDVCFEQGPQFLVKYIFECKFYAITVSHSLSLPLCDMFWCSSPAAVVVGGCSSLIFVSRQTFLNYSTTDIEYFTVCELKLEWYISHTVIFWIFEFVMLMAIEFSMCLASHCFGWMRIFKYEPLSSSSSIVTFALEAAYFLIPSLISSLSLLCVDTVE